MVFFIGAITHPTFNIFCYQVANCAECALVMLSDLRENHPNVTVEYLSMTKPDHSFNTHPTFNIFCYVLNLS
jgi:hypothetical protein